VFSVAAGFSLRRLSHALQNIFQLATNGPFKGIILPVYDQTFFSAPARRLCHQLFYRKQKMENRKQFLKPASRSPDTPQSPPDFSEWPGAARRQCSFL
jgi:hypothetical protein